MNKLACLSLSLLTLLLLHHPASARNLDINGLEAAFDQLLDPAKSTYTGAVAVVTHAGEVVLQKAYGYSDAQRSEPVDAQRTRFRLASTTKLLVAVALGQLMDQGLIKDIDDPVNQYLKSWQLTDNRGQAITLRMLATHQAGFAETRQPFQREGELAPAVDGAYLKAHQPPYIRPVNSGANYSNYGIDVLANVITELTGLSFKDYVQGHIFDRAGMTSATIVDRPVALADMAEAQMFYADGTSIGIHPAWANNPMNTASGALAASGADMGVFMLALMDPESGLLSHATRSLLMSRLAETHPEAQGYGFIFMHNRYNGEILIEHGGSTLGNISYTTLIPGHDLGIFISITGRKGIIPPGFEALGIVPAERNGPAVPLPVNVPGFFDARSAYLQVLLGLPRAPAAPLDARAPDLSGYVGLYISERRPASSVTGLFDLLLRGPGIIVSAAANDQLTIRDVAGYSLLKGDLAWRDPALEPRISTGWRDFYAFRRGADGEVSEMLSQYTDAVYVKRQGLASPVVQAWVLVVGGVLLFSGLALPLYAGGIRRNAVPFFLGIALLAVPATYIAAWPRLGSEALSYVSITPADLVPLQLTGNLCALLMLALPFSIRGRLPELHRAALFHYLMLAAAVPPTLWAFWQLDLVGWNIH